MKYYTQSDHKKSPFLSNYFVFGGIRAAHLFSFCVVLFVFFVFILCRVHPILPVSLDCPLLIDCLFGSLTLISCVKTIFLKKLKYIESSALYFTSLQRFNIGTAGSFYWSKQMTSLTSLRPLIHDC